MFKYKIISLFSSFLVCSFLFLYLGDNLFAGEKTVEYNPRNIKNEKLPYVPNKLIAQVTSLVDAERIATENNLRVFKTFKTLSRFKGLWYGVFIKNENKLP